MNRYRHTNVGSPPFAIVGDHTLCCALCVCVRSLDDDYSVFPVGFSLSLSLATALAVSPILIYVLLLEPPLIGPEMAFSERAERLLASPFI